MQRQITKRGYCSSSINLPRNWIIKNNIKDIIFVEEKGNFLILKPINIKEDIQIDMKEIIWKKHYFSSLYQQKITHIHFINISENNKSIIINNLWNYPGCEIMTNNDSNLNIKINLIGGNYKFHLVNAINELLFMINNINTNLNLNENLKKVYQFSELANKKINHMIPEVELYYINLITYTLTKIARYLFSINQYKLIKKITFSSKIKKLVELINQNLIFLIESIQKNTFDLKFYEENLRNKSYDELLNDFDYFKEFNLEEIFIVEKLTTILQFLNMIHSKTLTYLEFNNKFN